MNRDLITSSIITVDDPLWSDYPNVIDSMESALQFYLRSSLKTVEAAPEGKINEEENKEKYYERKPYRVYERYCDDTKYYVIILSDKKNQEQRIEEVYLLLDNKDKNPNFRVLMASPQLKTCLSVFTDNVMAGVLEFINMNEQKIVLNPYSGRQWWYDEKIEDITTPVPQGQYIKRKSLDIDTYIENEKK